MGSFPETYNNPIVNSGHRAQWSPIRSGITSCCHFYTWYLLSLFSLPWSLQLILEISATYGLVSYLLADLTNM